METKNTYKIPTTNLPILEEKIAKINRKAKKLGVEPVKFEFVGEPFTVKVSKNEAIRYQNVSIEGVAPKINGWAFVGTIQHLEEGVNIVRSVPGQELSESFRSVKPLCNHCNKIRNRIDTYVVKHDSGEFKQVGSNCLGDFLGALDPHNAAAWATILSDLDSMAREGFGGSGERVFDLVTYLGYVAMSIKESGWVSKKMSQDFPGLNPTSSAAITAMFPSKKDIEDGKVKYPTTENKEMASAALAWALNTYETKETLNDYEYNLSTVLQQEYIDYRMSGIAASLMSVYARAMEIEIVQRKERLASNYFGEVGKRADYILTLARVRSFDSQFGMTYMYKFIDATGNIAIWFTGKDDLEAGNTYKMKGTVKKQEEYKGVKQTTLTRCKVLETMKVEGK